MIFEENLINEGLEIERETFEDLNFIKVIITLREATCWCSICSTLFAAPCAIRSLEAVFGDS